MHTTLTHSNLHKLFSIFYTYRFFLYIDTSCLFILNEGKLNIKNGRVRLSEIQNLFSNFNRFDRRRVIYCSPKSTSVLYYNVLTDVLSSVYTRALTSEHWRFYYQIKWDLEFRRIKVKSQNEMEKRKGNMSLSLWISFLILHHLLCWFPYACIRACNL